MNGGRTRNEILVPVGQFLRFSLVGISCTTVFALFYWLIQPTFGAQIANFTAMLLGAVLNTAMNRTFTFGLHGTRGLAMHHLHGIWVFVLGWLLSAIALYAIHHIAPDASREAQLVVLLVVSTIAALGRFAVFRHIFRPTITLASEPQLL